MPYPFLSAPWLDALEELRPEAPEPPPEAKDITVNLIVRGGPDGDVHAHVRDGRLDHGLVDNAPTTVTVPFAVARRLVVDGEPDLVMQAVLTGEITIEGDTVNLMALQGSFGQPTAEHRAFHRKVRALTA